MSGFGRKIEIGEKNIFQMTYNKLADLLEFPILSREEAVVRHLMSQVLTKEKKTPIAAGALFFYLMFIS